MCRAVDAWASWVPPAASARLALDGQEVKCDALLALSFGHRGTKRTLPTRPLCANAGGKRRKRGVSAQNARQRGRGRCPQLQRNVPPFAVLVNLTPHTRAHTHTCWYQIPTARGLPASLGADVVSRTSTLLARVLMSIKGLRRRRPRSRPGATGSRPPASSPRRGGLAAGGVFS